MQLPEPKTSRLKKRPHLLRRLRELVDEDQLISRPEQLAAYECDALSAYRQRPMAVVLANDRDDVVSTVRACKEFEIPLVPWGAGTGLSGGALPLQDGVMLSLARMNRILDIDLNNRTATVQPGVTNLAITEAVKHKDFYYAPDPSSQLACTIGGNVAENSGGVHCLKYGVTTNNIMGLEVVLADGQVVRLGGKGMDQAGYDMLALLTGSEGLLAVITEVTVRLLRRPETAKAIMAVYDTVEAAGRAVANTIGAGMIPAGMEIMDRLSIGAVEDFVHAGYPKDAESLLLVELDGPASEVEQQMQILEGLLQNSGAKEIRVSKTEEERLRLWAGRKAAFGAMGHVSPDYYCMDGTIPRGKLPEVLRRITELSERFGLRVANVFHAGDGNLHPLVLYDGNVAGEMERAEEIGAEILKYCVEVGGVLSGEHGIGIEKRDLMPCMFGDADLDMQERVKDCFDPSGLLNPGKVFPVLRRCIEGGRMHVHGGETKFPDLERF